MRHAIIDNGTVVNIVEARQGYSMKSFTVVEDDGSAKMGGGWDGDSFTDPASVPASNRTMVYPNELVAMLTESEYSAASDKWKDELRSAAGRKISLLHPRTTKGLKTICSRDRVTQIQKGIPQ